MSTHTEATEFANAFLRRTGLNDTYSISSGLAEEVWDAAYDAFMWRSQPTLGIPTHEESAKDGMWRATAGTLSLAASPPIREVREVQDDAALDDNDGTFFGGGKL